MITLILIGTIGFAQTPLTKVSFEDQEAFKISSFPENDNISWTTITEHKYFNAGVDTTGTLPSCSYGFNNINGNQSATGDTLDIVLDYYSINNHIYYFGTQVTGSSSFNGNNLPIKSIGYDSDTAYIFTNSGGTQRFIHSIYNGNVVASWGFGSTSTAIQQDLDDYESITYLEFLGNKYLLFFGSFNSSLNGKIIDLNGTNATIWNGSVFNFTSAFFNNTGLFYSVGNEIFYSDDEVVLPLQSSPDADLIVYTIPTGQVINDITITYNGIFYAAASDGIYSSNISLNIKDQEESINIDLYPNPNNGTFTISDVEEGTTTQILNQAGQIVYETKDFGNIDLNLEVPAGIYFVRLTTETSSKTIKFVKQ